MTVDVAASVATDAAGNNNTIASQSTQAVDTVPVTVVFDLVNSTSTNVHSREFQAGTSYVIELMVNPHTEKVSFNALQKWAGADNLGTDDLIVLMSNNSWHVEGAQNKDVTRVSAYSSLYYWQTPSGPAVYISNNGKFVRNHNYLHSTIDLWDGTWASNPNLNGTAPNAIMSQIYGVNSGAF
jgi:hypothetical protein